MTKCNKIFCNSRCRFENRSYRRRVPNSRENLTFFWAETIYSKLINFWEVYFFNEKSKCYQNSRSWFPDGPWWRTLPRFIGSKATSSPSNVLQLCEGIKLFIAHSTAMISLWEKCSMIKQKICKEKTHHRKNTICFLTPSDVILFVFISKINKGEQKKWTYFSIKNNTILEKPL